MSANIRKIQDLNHIEDGSVMAGLLMLEVVYPNGVELTLDEIAFVCGCSHERIRQIQKNAMEKIKIRLKKIFEERGINYEKELTKKREAWSSGDIVRGVRIG